MTAAIEPRANLPALTGMRGVAAWYVVLFHIRVGAETQLGPTVTAILAKGYLAVDLFFLLSGFVLWLNYADRLRGRGAGAGALFLARRLARIWPLHMFILCCAAAFALVLALTGRSSASYPWAELPLHLLLLQNWGFTDALTWNEPAWSISCEWAAYLLFPLLAAAVDWRRFSATSLILLLVLLATTLHLILATGGAATLGDDIPRFGLIRALTEFAMGTILCALWRRWRDRSRGPLVAAFGVLALLGPASIAGVMPETLTLPLMLAAMLMIVGLTASSAHNPLGWRWIHYLGEISYSTYLVHFLFYILFKILFVSDPANVPMPLLGLFLMLVLLASAALHHLVERPAQRAINRAVDAVRKPALASA